MTSDEVGDPHNLAIRLRLNGKTMQDSSTKQLIFNTGQIIAYLSQVFPLEPGDSPGLRPVSASPVNRGVPEGG